MGPLAPSCFDDVLADDGQLLHVLPHAVHLNFFFVGQVVLFSELLCRTPPSCIKVIGGGGWWPTGFYCQPQSSFGFIWVGTGLDWVGIGSRGIGDSGVRD